MSPSNYISTMLARSGLLLVALAALTVCLIGSGHAEAKKTGFIDPNTNNLYTLISLNATNKSLIKITRVKLDERRKPVGQPELIQTLGFTPALVDFDLHCTPNHCYLVTVTSRTRANVELFSWQRTQFDSSAIRDSFARPHAVKLIGIQSGFYIAIAQDQLHLSPYRYSLAASDDGEPTRFMGCAILKFVKGHEHDVKYHQFIRLPFNPRYVNAFTTRNSNNISDPTANVGPAEDHHLVFSSEPNWADPDAKNVRSFIWSPLNDYFWPYLMPRGAEVVQSKPGTQVLKFPEPLQPLALNTNDQRQQQDYISSVETCFYQLQRVLTDRDLQARRLIESSGSIWRAPSEQNPTPAGASLTNISAQVIVHGNVIVMGSIIDNPQVSIIGANQRQPAAAALPPDVKHVAHLVNSHSPAIVENKFHQAQLKLKYIRDKLSRAVSANFVADGMGASSFYSQIRFFGPLEANEVIFRGVANSNLRLNGIPFKQLEKELVSLSGAQNIGGRIEFEGKVVADRLEIHGLINDQYYLKDAIDIASDRIQIIETTSRDQIVPGPGQPTVQFKSVSAPEVILAHNSTINTIALNEFITRDNRTQFVYGRKTFKRLSMANLDLAHHAIPLNGFNITRIARNAIRLRPEQGKSYQIISGNHQVTFMKSIHVTKLTLNNIINHYINITSLIHDSIKSNTYEVQQIFGLKNFLSGLKIGRLNTEGALNGIGVSQIFNLNSLPPVAEQHRSINQEASSSPYDVPITGEFTFRLPVEVSGNVNANLVNGIDLARRAIRRSPPNPVQPMGDKQQLKPQIVTGHKIFFRPLRIINDIRLIDLQQASRYMNNATRIPYPLVNGIDVRMISAGLARQKQQPPPVYVDNLEIEGNLDLPAQPGRDGSSRARFGNLTVCPLDLIRSRVVLAGIEDQVVESPIRVGAIRARSILVEPGALNKFDFPNDFVLRTAPSASPSPVVEPVYGVKTIEHLVVSPAMVPPPSPTGNAYEPASGRRSGGYQPASTQRGIVLERGVSINQVPYSELHSFMAHEQNLNSTGEKVFNTMNVYGNLHSKRINGHYWPDDILLRSVSSTIGATPSMPFLHKRIYSHLIFTNTSNLHVENQLVLRGPIQLNGRMNGVNLTEFSRQSATYGDKDLYSNGRPLRNKIFMGGLTVRTEIRSQGFIDGVNIEEMKQRVVTVGPRGKQMHVLSPKIFTDVSFDGPVRMAYLNDMLLDNYLSKIRFEPDGTTLRVRNKKTITGALRINRNLYVRGLINGVDFAELKARAISLAPSDHELAFNKTLIVEGDVFMDNLWIDERNGTIDGVKLKNLVQVGPAADEITLTNFQVIRRSDPYGRRVDILGTLMDCQVSCETRPVIQQLHNQTSSMRSLSYLPQTVRPVVVPAQPVMAFTSRPTVFNNQGNYVVTRTTPPYGLASSYQPPLMPTPRPVIHVRPDQMQQLVNRKPVSIRYDQRQAPVRRYVLPDRTAIVAEQLEALRKQIVSMKLIRMAAMSNLVVGFIDAPTNDVSTYIMSEQDLSHYEHTTTNPSSFLLLDQIDFPFRPTIYHLSVGVSTNRRGQNVTSVTSSFGGTNLREISVLPVEYPNSAMFVNIQNGILFLLISQDRPMKSDMCPATGLVQSTNKYFDDAAAANYYNAQARPDSGIQVYLFHALQSSSSLNSAYFDLYQTIDLQGIDSFDKFTYANSSYVLAISRQLNRIYLLLLRGYTGFQLVSYIDVPAIESVTIMYANDQRPALLVRQTNGIHRIMEAVVI
jgi:hypothetical protein